MNQQEWLATDDSAAMLRWVLSNPPEIPSRIISERKLCMFARACVELGQTDLSFVPEHTTPGGMSYRTWARNCVDGLPGGPSKPRMADLFRCILGDIFNTVLVDHGQPEHNRPGDPWLTPTVLSLARAAYHDRPKQWVEGDYITYVALDSLTLMALADAMEEAGCVERDILAHLRSSLPHFQGCWALDLILGLE